MIDGRARAVAMGAALIVAGCGRDPDRRAPAARVEDDARVEPIVVHRGERELRVRCVLGCDAVRGELDALQRACAGDVRSAPRQLSEQPAMIALGCCTEAESVQRETCGGEALESCISRWSAECASRALGSR